MQPTQYTILLRLPVLHLPAQGETTLSSLRQKRTRQVRGRGYPLSRHLLPKCQGRCKREGDTQRSQKEPRIRPNTIHCSRQDCRYTFIFLFLKLINDTYRQCDVFQILKVFEKKQLSHTLESWSLHETDNINTPICIPYFLLIPLVSSFLHPLNYHISQNITTRLSPYQSL